VKKASTINTITTGALMTLTRITSHLGRRPFGRTGGPAWNDGAGGGAPASRPSCGVLYCKRYLLF